MSPNYSGTLTDPSLVLLHYTVSGDFGTTKAWLCDKKSKVSAHYLIGRKGECEKLVPLDRCAWHAGKSKWGELESLNKYAIGIELVSWGPLVLQDQKYVSAVTGAVVPSEEVVHSRHPQGGKYLHWQSYTEPQLAELNKVLRGLFLLFPSLADIRGHYEVSPGRKADPFPLDLDTLRRKYAR